MVCKEEQELFDTDVKSVTRFSGVVPTGLLLNSFGDHLLSEDLLFWLLLKTVRKLIKNWL